MMVAVKGDKKVVQSTLHICGFHIARFSQVGINCWKKIQDVSKKQNLDMLYRQPLFT